MLGGPMLGVLQALVVWVGSAHWVNAATFLVLMAFLIVRPRGLLGGSFRRRR